MRNKNEKIAEVREIVRKRKVRRRGKGGPSIHNDEGVGERKPSGKTIL